MAISRITTQDATGSGTTSPVSASYPTVATKGHLLVAIMYANSASIGLNAISGWSVLCDGLRIPSGQEMSIHYKLSDGTESSVSATNSGSPNLLTLDIFEYLGNANPLVLDGTPATQNNSNTSVQTYTTPSITTSGKGSLILSAMVLGTITSPAWSKSTLFGLNQPTGGLSIFCGEYITYLPNNNFSDTATWTTAKGVGSMIGGFLAAPGAGDTLYKHVIVSDGMSRSEVAN